MTPESAPLAALPTTKDGMPVFLPVLGRGTDPAARFLRGVAENGQPVAKITEAGRLARLLTGNATVVGKRLWLAVFPNNSAVFGAVQGAYVRFYPQPLFAPQGSATHALLARSPDLVEGLLTSVRLSPPVARSAEAALLGGHMWPSWATIDLSGTQVAKNLRPSPEETQALVFNLVHARTAPACPPQWRSLERIEIAVYGRMVTLDGTTTPTAQILDGPVVAHNTAWAERLCKGLEALFGDPALFPAWTLVRQTIGGTGTSPLDAGVVWQKTVQLQHNSMSAHQRMACAGGLPAHVIAA
jgi:hypothetical protein